MSSVLHNVNVKKQWKHDELNNALLSLELRQKQGLSIHRETVYSLLRASAQNLEISVIRRLYLLISKSGLLSVSCFGDHLIRLFGSCGCLIEADNVFAEVAKPSLFTWNAIISMHVKFGEAERALQLGCKMREEGFDPDNYILSCLLKACGSLKEERQGRLVHIQIIRKELEKDDVLGNGLIDMYAKCGNLDDSRRVFDGWANQDAVAWGTMIAGCVRQNQCLLALEFFVRMISEGLKPTKITLIVVIKACSNCSGISSTNISCTIIHCERSIHDHILRCSFESDILIGSSLIDMYAKYGCLDDALCVFERLQERNVVSWGALIAGHVQHGHNISALKLFDQMQQEGIVASKVTFLFVLKACGNMEALDWGMLLHHQIITSGLQIDMPVGSSVLDMYAKCGKLHEARKIFYCLPSRDIVSWGAMIGGHAQHGEAILALQFFEKMQENDVKPNKATFLSALKACGNLENVELGQQIHDQIIKSDSCTDMMVASSLIDMYGKCGSLEESNRVFRRLLNPDAVSWGALIAGYALHEEGAFALDLFSEMQRKHVKADKFVLSCSLKACGNIGSIIDGRWIHDEIIRSGLDIDVVIGNALIDMFSKCGSLHEASEVFANMLNKDAVSWGTMIGGYVQHGYGFSALEVFENMHQSQIKPDKVIFVSILTACSDIQAIGQGRLVHKKILQSGIELDEALGNALLDMYVKCGDLKEARKVFDEWPKRNVVSWDVMIAGYVEHGLNDSALELFKNMLENNLAPNKAIFSCILRACGSTGAVDGGRLVHDLIIKGSIEEDVAMGSSIVDMYAKCGNLYEAHQVVMNNLTNSNVVAWGALIGGFAQHGDFILVRQCLQDMEQCGVLPNETIFLNILATCSHTAHMEDGLELFKSMAKDYGLNQSAEHYSCIVDLFGRAGQLKEATDLLCSMPLLPTNVAWTSLLLNCRTHGNSYIGKDCFEQLCSSNPVDAI